MRSGLWKSRKLGGWDKKRGESRAGEVSTRGRVAKGIHDVKRNILTESNSKTLLSNDGDWSRGVVRAFA